MGTGASAINCSNIYLSFRLDYGEQPAEQEHFVYCGDLALFNTLSFVRDGMELVQYSNYNLLTAFVRNFLTDRGDECDYDSGSQPLVGAVDDKFKTSYHHHRYERLLLFANDYNLHCDGELTLTLCKDCRNSPLPALLILRPMSSSPTYACISRKRHQANRPRSQRTISKRNS